MVRKIFYVLICLIAISPLNAFNISISINNAIGSETIHGQQVPVVGVGKPFGIEVVVEKADRNTQEVDLVGLDKFDLLGKGQSMSVAHVNGNVTSTTTIQLTVKARQEGVFEVGPARVRHNGNSVESNVLAIKAVNNPTPPQEQKSGAQASSNMRCTLTADSTSLVVGQPVVVHAKMYLQGPVLEMGLTPFTAPDFLVKEIQQPLSFNETTDGKTWNVIEKKYIVTPLQPGDKKINGVTATVSVPSQQKRSRGGFFGEDFISSVLGMGAVEQKQLTSNDLTFTVKKLPEHDKPVDAVGEFSTFHASLSAHEATVNEPLVLTLTLEGKGNLDSIAIPKLNLDPTFKYYESKNTTHQNLTNDFTPGKKVFEFIVQANKAGEFTIPAQQFTFYDPTLKGYKTLTTGSLPVVIKPSTQQHNRAPALPDEPETPTFNQEPEAPSAQDISFIQEDLGNTHNPALPWWLFAFIFTIPCALFYGSKLRLLSSRIGFSSKKQNAKKSETKHQKLLAAIIEKNNIKHVHPFFIKFLAEQSKTDISLITEDWIEQYLSNHAWESKKIQEFIDYLSSCAQLNFSHQNQSDQTYAILLKKAQYWFLMLTQ